MVLNLIVWYAIPSILFSALGSDIPSLGFAPSLIYEFGAAITALQVAGALTEGKVISVPFNAGSYAVSAFYLWVILNEGKLSFTEAGAKLVLSFQPLLFLLMIPSLFSLVRVPVTYLLEETEAASESPDRV
jgi:hypothetical protein